MCAEKMQTPEGFVKKKVRNYLVELGAYFFFPVQMGIGSPTVDILCASMGSLSVSRSKLWVRSQHRDNR